MGVGYDALIDELEDKLDLAETEMYRARSEISKAQSHWNQGDDHACLDDLIDAVEYNNRASEYITAEGFWGWNGGTHALTDALNRDKACPFITECPPSEVTMDSILLAMLSAAPDELKKFIGLVDAFRASLWNKPFNVEFYAALTRGFMG